MARYKVITGSVSGAANKVFYEFQEADDVAFGGKERAKQLVKDGFLEEIKDGKLSAKEAKDKEEAEAKGGNSNSNKDLKDKLSK